MQFFESLDDEISYFLRADYRSRLWRTINEAGPALPLRFGSSLNVIDQFHGRKPFLANRRFHEHCAAGQQMPMRVRPTLLLDGSAVTPLHNMVAGRRQEAKDRSAIVDMVSFAIDPSDGVTPEFDINCVLYYSENLPKQNDSNAEIFRDYGRTILAVRTLDRDFFRQSRVVRIDPERLAEAHDEYGSQDLDYIATSVLEKMQGVTRGDFADEMYAALLKLQLVKDVCGGDVDAAFREMFWFLLEHMNLVVARVLLLAMTYFCGDPYVDGFLPYKREMKPDRVRAKTRSSAWDLAFLSAPDLALAAGDDLESTWCYIVTGDNRLAEIGRRFEVVAVARMFEDREYLWPFIGYQNPAAVALRCADSEAFNHLMRVYYAELLPSRMFQRRNGCEIDGLISELEGEVDRRYRGD